MTGLRAAREALDAVRVRRRAFPELRLGDPTWCILLDLFVARAQRRRTSVSSACLAAGVPMTSATRLLRELEAAGLVRREPCARDRRRIFVALTDAAAARVGRCLSERPH